MNGVTLNGQPLCEICGEVEGTIPSYCDKTILLCKDCNVFHRGRFTCPFHGDDH